MTAWRFLVVTIAAVSVGLAGCSRPDEQRGSTSTEPSGPGPAAAHPPAPTPAPTHPPAPAHDPAGIAWRDARDDADVAAAFDEARRTSRPVFVYWGATWCPPCNQVKATLFNRHDFIERSRAFVAVYVDGDSPGAQKLGARFHVSGYPTMLLFSPRGAELTRLPGEVDAARYNEVLTLGMNADQPVREVLARALAGGAGVAPNDWRLLGFYSWETDQQQLVAKDALPAALARLAATCPASLPEIAQRFQLQALAATDAHGSGRSADPALQTALVAMLADPVAARAQTDLLTNSAADIVRAASAAVTPQRQRLIAAFDTALQRLEADATLSRADRVTALAARVDLAKLDAERSGAEKSGAEKSGAATAGRSDVPPAGTPAPLPAALLADLRATAARVDREITDGYERQAVVTAAADALDEAGLGAESDALLRANLAKSHSPYYLMSELAVHAKKRGDTTQALRWYADAFAASEGPATRLQWGASYVNALVELAPQDEARIESTTAGLFREAAATPDAFYERSGRSLQRVGKALLTWSQLGGGHAATLSRLRAQLSGICVALPAADPNRAACDAVLKAPAGKRV